VQRRTGAFQRDESACYECGVDSGPVNRHIKDVTKHRCESDFEREVHVCGIAKRVGHKKAFWFWQMCRRARRPRQKKEVQYDGQANAVGQGDPDPEKSADQQFG
jgi:hypothetical protein